MTKISFLVGKKRISLEAESLGFFGRVIGLMFSRREKAGALVFSFRKPTRTSIHSFFVFFPFIAIWLGPGGNLIEARIVEPFTFSVSPKREFTKLIEIPLNKKYSKLKILPPSVIRKI